MVRSASWPNGRRGASREICIVVGGAGEPPPAERTRPRPRVLELATSGTRLKDAATIVARGIGLGKRELYEAALERRAAASQ